MGELYDKMKMDMELKNFSPKTVRCYLGHMRSYAMFFKQSPAELTEQHIREYLHHLITEKDASQSMVSQSYSALKFFYTVTLQRGWDEQQIPRAKRRRYVPLVFTPAEVGALLDAVKNLKHKAILTTIYSAGLRIGEAVHLVPEDIDSSRMLIRVRQGKGRKDRYTLLSEKTLALLRTYWSVYRPKTWLFPGREPQNPVHLSTVRKVFNARSGFFFPSG